MPLGIPFDLAFDMDPTMRKAVLIAHGFNKGGDFDFNAWAWRKQE